MISRLAIPFLLLAILSGEPFAARAQQYTVKGRVIDSETHDALAFVNILVNNGPAGTATDIDGKFKMSCPVPPKILKISYIGYEPLVFPIDLSVKELTIRLKKKQVELSELVIRPGINPANRIIQKVLENRPMNDHEKMSSFGYTTYEKVTFGPDTDTIPWSDSIRADTALLHMKKFFDRQHLFLMESVTERKFLYPDRNYNKVVASRVSGFGDPLFVFLMSQLQSTSFYKEVINISDKEYINPVSRGTFSKYYFEIRDTLIEPHPYDTTFIMTFRPLLNTNFDGLKGTLSVSTNGYAIRNVIAQPARVSGTMTIKIQQLYDFVQDSHWFPLQLNTDIIFRGAIGKGSISVGVGSGNVDSTRKDLVGRGKSYISDIRLEPGFKKSDFGFVDVDVQPDAYRKPENVWQQYRVDSLSRRDRQTYHVLDSLGKAKNFDKLGYKFDAIFNGKIPLGPLDLELSKILNLSRYEDLRLGAGLQTNDRFSGLFRLGGYTAYGSRDEKWKFGGNAGIIVDKFQQAGFEIAFDDDIHEAGSKDPFDLGSSLINPEMYRHFLVSRMDHLIRQRVSAGSRVFNFAQLKLSFSRADEVPEYTYAYVTGHSEGLQVTSSEFITTELSIALRYAYGEKFIKNTRSLISLGTTYPVIWLAFSHGLNGLASGQYTYNRLDFRMQKTFSFKYLGKTSVLALAGFLDRDLPYTDLFNGLGDYNSFSLYSTNSFATMRMSEFVADRFAAVFITHNFGKLLFRSRHFNPEPALALNMGCGSLRHPENHTGIGIRSYEKGYFESGLLINNILNMGFAGFGIGSFYRFGPYAFPAWNDNFALKLTLSFSF